MIVVDENDPIGGVYNTIAYFFSLEWQLITRYNKLRAFSKERPFSLSNQNSPRDFGWPNVLAVKLMMPSMEIWKTNGSIVKLKYNHGALQPKRWVNQKF